MVQASIAPLLFYTQKKPDKNSKLKLPADYLHFNTLLQITLHKMKLTQEMIRGIIQPIGLTIWLNNESDKECNRMKEKQVEQDIINAAIKVFVEKGKDGARMQEIADHAGVNKMLLHYYFRNKDTLFLEVVKKIVFDLYGSVIEESMNSPTFKEFLYVFIDRHFKFLNERKDSFQFLLWELSRKQFDLKKIVSGSYAQYGKNPFELILVKLNEAIAKGEIRTVDTTEFIMNLFSLDLFIFIALPVIREIVPMDDTELADAIERRKEEVFRLLWNDIKIS